MKSVLGVRQLKSIDDLVTHYVRHKELFDTQCTVINGYLQSSSRLQTLAHSFKSRIKDPDHLKDKLKRKALEAKEKKEIFSINNDNLFLRINDLVGFRIIHLHTKQVEEINTELKRIFDENSLIIVEGPEARTWDDEMRSYYESIGMNIHKSPNPDMYTSVHYVVKLNSRLDVTCEIQVRTLMEEVWGEVSHSINYPHPTNSLSCREQIKVLARVTSGCSRLVDSIFTTNHEHNLNMKNIDTGVSKITKKKVRKKKRAKKKK